MVKAKRFNLSMALVVVLSVLLTLAISVGATLAWFSDTDFGTTELEMSGAVLVKLASNAEDEDDYEKAVGGQVVFNRPADLLQPGMTITPEIYTVIQGSTTSSLVRIRLEVTASWDEGNTSYLYGWTVEEGEGDTTYTNGTLTGQTEEQVKALVKGEIEEKFYASIDASANASGWYRHNGYYYFFGNGETYSKHLTKLGEAATGSTPAVAPEYEDTVNAKAGATIESPVVANIPTYATVGEGEEATLSTTMLTNLNSTQLASVVTGADNDAHIAFLVDAFEVPRNWGNEVAGANIEIQVRVQAMQDYVIDVAQTGPQPAQFPTLNYAIAQFNDAFPSYPAG